MADTDMIEAVDALLPQTQCGKCGHDGCRPYAEAIAEGEAINRCPPGGDATIKKLAALTGQPVIALEQPAQSPLVAYIREDECIGCTKCIQACPVDAILGAAKQMHTVIESECTGCELCVAPCPVDCIDLLPHPEWQAAQGPEARQAYLDKRAHLGRRRHEARQKRLEREAEEKRQRRLERQTRQASSRQPTSTISSAQLRTHRASLVASLNKLDRQRRDTTLTDEARQALEQRAETLQTRLADIDRQLADVAAPATRGHEDRHQRFAVNAAEQACRRARQQIAHADRHGTRQDQDAARQQLERARQILDEARQALSSSH